MTVSQNASGADARPCKQEAKKTSSRQNAILLGFFVGIVVGVGGGYHFGTLQARHEQLAREQFERIREVRSVLMERETIDPAVRKGVEAMLTEEMPKKYSTLAMDTKGMESARLVDCQAKRTDGSGYSSTVIEKATVDLNAHVEGGQWILDRTLVTANYAPDDVRAQINQCVANMQKGDAFKDKNRALWALAASAAK
jgi:hypothetical protein